MSEEEDHSVNLEIYNDGVAIVTLSRVRVGKELKPNNSLAKENIFGHSPWSMINILTLGDGLNNNHSVHAGVPNKDMAAIEMYQEHSTIGVQKVTFCTTNGSCQMRWAKRRNATGNVQKREHRKRQKTLLEFPEHRVTLRPSPWRELEYCIAKSVNAKPLYIYFGLALHL